MTGTKHFYESLNALLVSVSQVTKILQANVSYKVGAYQHRTYYQPLYFLRRKVKKDKIFFYIIMLTCVSLPSGIKYNFFLYPFLLKNRNG